MPVTANSIVTPQTPQSSNAACSAANTTYTTSPTNTVLLITAGANGARVTRIAAIALETLATAVQLQLFRSRDAGTTKQFFRSGLAGAYTMADTTEVPTVDLGYSDDNPMILAPNERIYAAVRVAKQITFNAEWADY
jgi:hypothetical protein